MQRSRYTGSGGGEEGGPQALSDGLKDVTFHTAEWHAGTNATPAMGAVHGSNPSCIHMLCLIPRYLEPPWYIPCYVYPIILSTHAPRYAL